MKKPKEKSPLDGLKKAFERGEVVIDREAIKKRMEEMRQDEEDKKHRRGKYAPPTGICAVCGGKVVDKVTREYRGDPMRMIIGPGSRNQMSTVHHGWYCIACGIRYEFLPKGKPSV